MFKKLTFFAAAALVGWSCSLVKEDRATCPLTAPVNVHLSGFRVSQEGFPATKTTLDVADYAGVNSLTLGFFDPEGTPVYTSTQSSGTAGFGDFSLSLPMGSYTMVAVAYTTKEGSPFTLTSPTSASFTGLHAYETFVCTQAVNVTNAINAVDISATLERIVTGLTVNSTDGKTANVTNVRMSFSAGGKSFNPTTGFATVDTGFNNTVGVTAAVGSTSCSKSIFFLSTDEETMDVTIETLDSSGNTLSSAVAHNVPFKRNRVTVLTGAMYTNKGVGGSFQLSTDWLSDHNASF